MKEGLEIELGGKKYCAPALPLKDVRRILPLAKKFADGGESALDTDASIALAVDVVVSSLRCNYPDMTTVTIEAESTFLEIMHVSGAILAYSGFAPAGNQTAMGPTEG